MFQVMERPSMEDPINNAKDIVVRDLTVLTDDQTKRYVKRKLLEVQESEWTQVADSMVFIKYEGERMKNFITHYVFNHTHVMIASYLLPIVYASGPSGILSILGAHGLNYKIFFRKKRRLVEVREDSSFRNTLIVPYTQKLDLQ